MELQSVVRREVAAAAVALGQDARRLLAAEGSDDQKETTIWRGLRWCRIGAVAFAVLFTVVRLAARTMSCRAHLQTTSIYFMTSCTPLVCLRLGKIHRRCSHAGCVPRRLPRQASDRHAAWAARREPRKHTIFGSWELGRGGARSVSPAHPHRLHMFLVCCGGLMHICTSVCASPAGEQGENCRCQRNGSRGGPPRRLICGALPHVASTTTKRGKKIFREASARAQTKRVPLVSKLRPRLVAAAELQTFSWNSMERFGRLVEAHVWPWAVALGACRRPTGVPLVLDPLQVSTGDNFLDGLASGRDPAFESGFRSVFNQDALIPLPWHVVLGAHSHTPSAFYYQP